MAGEQDEDLFAKHFEAAGIKEAAQPNGEDNANEGAEGSSSEESIGSEGQVDGKPEENAAKATEDKRQTADGKDSHGKSADPGKEQGKKTEGKDSGNPGDLKLPDGSTVRAGAERRFYESLQTEKQRNQYLQSEMQKVQGSVKELTTKLQTYEDNFKQIGVTDPAQVSSAIRLYRDLSTNPVGVLKQLLAEAKALGHNLDGIGPGVDTQAIQLMIDQRLGKPAENTQQVDVEAAAAKETADFINKFPDALTHENEIAQLVALNPQMSLTDIYFEFKNAVISQGLDWRQPLQPQIEARKQPPVTPNAQPGLPNGRGPVSDAAASFDEKDILRTPARSDSLDDIIRQSMRDNGMLKN